MSTLPIQWLRNIFIIFKIHIYPNASLHPEKWKCYAVMSKLIDLEMIFLAR